MTHSEEPTTIESRVDTDAPLTISLDEALEPHAPAWTPDLEKFDRELNFAFSFQRRLLELRHALGLTQTQAGEIAGEHQTEMSRMERGRFTPSFARGSRILAALESARAPRTASLVASEPAEKPRTYRARQIAHYFLFIQDPEDPITNLKIQKLLYFAKGTFLSTRQAPLFGERILAWEHGPVVYAVWREYASHKREPLPSPTDFDPETIDPETRSLLDVVYRRWGRYAAFTLRDMTHKDGPWKDTARDAEIDESAIQAYFTELLSGPASPAVHG